MLVLVTWNLESQSQVQFAQKHRQSNPGASSDSVADDKGWNSLRYRLQTQAVVIPGIQEKNSMGVVEKEKERIEEGVVEVRTMRSEKHDGL